MCLILGDRSPIILDVQRRGEVRPAAKRAAKSISNAKAVSAIRGRGIEMGVGVRAGANGAKVPIVED